MRAQDFVGWLVPAYVLTASISALVIALAARRYSDLWLPVTGMGLGVALVVGLLRRRKEWMRGQEQTSLPKK